jgi:hypothetical protein
MDLRGSSTTMCASGAAGSRELIIRRRRLGQ